MTLDVFFVTGVILNFLIRPRRQPADSRPNLIILDEHDVADAAGAAGDKRAAIGQRHGHRAGVDGRDRADAQRGLGDQACELPPEGYAHDAWRSTGMV